MPGRMEYINGQGVPSVTKSCIYVSQHVARRQCKCCRTMHADHDMVWYDPGKSTPAWKKTYLIMSDVVRVYKLVVPVKPPYVGLLSGITRNFDPLSADLSSHQCCV